MPPTRDAIGTIAFTLGTALGQIWNVVTPVNKPPWKPWPPIEPFMKAFVTPFMGGYYRPIVIGLTGLIIFLVWEGKRSGYVLSIIVTGIAAAFGVSILIFNALNEEWLACLSATTAVAFPAVMALWFSLQGYRRYGSEKALHGSAPVK